MRKVWIILLGVGVLAAGFFLVQSQQPANAAPADDVASEQSAEDAELKEQEEEKEEMIYAVELAQATERSMQIYQQSTATLQADRQVDIFSKTPGQISELPLEEGMRVKAGQTLLVLDAADARLRLDQSRVKLEKANAEFQRIARSYEKDLVSTEEYETRKYQLETARAEFDLAKHEVAIARVAAPFDGTIVTRDVELGQTIQTSQKLFSLATLDLLEAEVFLPEARVAGLREDMTVQLSRDDNFKEPISGRVARISPVVDRETGTVKVTVAIQDVPRSLRPGAYVHLRIVTSERSYPSVVPQKALIYDSRQNAYVFITEPTDRPAVYTVKKTPVTTGTVDGGQVAITQGLERGSSVVLTGKESLKDGALVRDAAEGVQTIARK